MAPRLNLGGANRRVNWWYGVLLLILAVCVTRLFYLQIIRYDHYRQAALNDQLKQYAIPAERGTISAHEAGSIVPLVLNQKLYTLYADPTFIKNADTTADKVAAVMGADVGHYLQLMRTKNTRYVILAKRVSDDQNKRLQALKLPGIGTQASDYRTYPQGSLASQLLGFVNNDGKGTYGIEQALNNKLSGTPGQLKAITDAAGVPLAASPGNVRIDPKNGDKIILTLDLGMQAQLENILKNDIKNVTAAGGSAVIMDANSGAIKAMANYPTYEPSQYYNVSDASLFTNPVVSAPLEVGSTMKVLTMAAALDQGVIKTDTTYDDPNHWTLDGHDITNIEEDGGPGTHSMAQVLDLSINTGATWILMQMGGKTGEVNQQARDRWHNYMVNHYQLGKPTNIEQGYEAQGYIPDPQKGYALELTYANTAFGQAMTATPLQMASAYASVVNGGTYYQPHLVDQLVESNGKSSVKQPVIVKRNVVSRQASKDIRGLMEYVVHNHYLTGFSYLNFPDNYSVGGKTGTAQIANPAGGYYADKYNGTYGGFVGGDKPQYVIFVTISQPHGVKYAGSGAAQPVFSDLAHMLINDFNVTPKSGS